MAVITPTYPNRLVGREGQVLWETLTCGDTGALIKPKKFTDNTITVTGTFNSQTVTILGSNDGGTTSFTLTDNNGLPCTFTSAGAKLLAEVPDDIWPSFSGSSGGDIDVRAQLRRS